MKSSGLFCSRCFPNYSLQFVLCGSSVFNRDDLQIDVACKERCLFFFVRTAVSLRKLYESVVDWRATIRAWCCPVICFYPSRDVDLPNLGFWMLFLFLYCRGPQPNGLCWSYWWFQNIVLAAKLVMLSFTASKFIFSASFKVPGEYHRQNNPGSIEKARHLDLYYFQKFQNDLSKVNRNFWSTRTFLQD